MCRRVQTWCIKYRYHAHDGLEPYATTTRYMGADDVGLEPRREIANAIQSRKWVIRKYSGINRPAKKNNE